MLQHPRPSRASADVLTCCVRTRSLNVAAWILDQVVVKAAQTCGDRPCPCCWTALNHSEVTSSTQASVETTAGAQGRWRMQRVLVKAPPEPSTELGCAGLAGAGSRSAEEWQGEHLELVEAQRHVQLSPTPPWPCEADVEWASCRAQVKAPAKKLKQSSSGASEWYGPGRPGYLGMPQTLNCTLNMHGCKRMLRMQSASPCLATMAFGAWAPRCLSVFFRLSGMGQESPGGFYCSRLSRGRQLQQGATGISIHTRFRSL